jgi:4-hydroxy-3-polyprenylbenzoate decarboxylase
MKVVSALFGAGQMMFTKYMIVVNGDVDIRNYRALASFILKNTNLSRDLFFTHGPLDVLDHSSDNFSFGGKIGLDATVKMTEELQDNDKLVIDISQINTALIDQKIIEKFYILPDMNNLPVIIVAVDRTKDSDIIARVAEMFSSDQQFRLIVVVDHTVDVADLFMVAWQLFGNTDPVRDHIFVSPRTILIDATIKMFRKNGFPRKWPNVVLSSPETISAIDEKWQSAELGPFIASPSLRYLPLKREGTDAVTAG